MKTTLCSEGAAPQLCSLWKLCSNPDSEPGTLAHAYNSSSWETGGASQVQGQPGLHTRFQASLSYLVLKKKKSKYQILAHRVTVRLGTHSYCRLTRKMPVLLPVPATSSYPSILSICGELTVLPEHRGTVWPLKR